MDFNGIKLSYSISVPWRLCQGPEVLRSWVQPWVESSLHFHFLCEARRGVKGCARWFLRAIALSYWPRQTVGVLHAYSSKLGLRKGGLSTPLHSTLQALRLRNVSNGDVSGASNALRLINVTSERRMQAAEYSPHQSGNKVAGTEPEQGSSAEAGMQAHPAFTAPASSMQHVTALLQPQQPAPLPRIGPGPMVQGYRHRAIMQLAASVGAANQAQLHQQQQQQLRARLRQAHALHNGQTHAHVVVFFFKLERLAVGGDMWRPSAWPTANLRSACLQNLATACVSSVGSDVPALPQNTWISNVLAMIPATLPEKSKEELFVLKLCLTPYLG
eukprot:scaffold127852_cov17-Tisochrysis_lutea.AAC.1